MPPSEITDRLKTLEDENLRLRRAVEELSILNDLSRSIGALQNSEEIIQTVVRRSLRAVSAEQGVVTLVEESEHDSMKTLVRTAEVSMERVKYHFNQALLGWMYINKKPLVVNDPASDERFRGVQWDESIQSLLVVPLIVKSKIRGVLSVYNKKDRMKFTDDDLRLLSIIAAQSAQIVENARLNEQEKALMKMQDELKVAASIQTELLPSTLPSIAGYDLFADTIPAASVGGDSYDVIPAAGSGMALCIADVSGKGMPAALLMANLQATLRASVEARRQPSTILDQSNHLLFRSTSPEKFATVFLAVLDPSTHRLTYANAGHDPAVVLAGDGSTSELPSTGLPVGLFEGIGYEEAFIDLRPNDTVVIFTDGITESMDAEQAQFGRQRILETLSAHRHGSAKEIGKALLESVAAFSKGAPQSDDRTLLVVKRLATP